MHEDHSLETLLKRLDLMSGELDELRQEIRLTVQLVDIDPRMTLTRTRRVLEYLVNDIFRRHFEEDPGTRPLDNLLDRVIKEHVLPPRVAAYAQGIRWLGNMGTHGKGEQVLHTDAEQSLKQLVEILLWYFEHERPDALAGQTAQTGQTGQAGLGGTPVDSKVALDMQPVQENVAVDRSAPSGVDRPPLKVGVDRKDEPLPPEPFLTRLKRAASSVWGRVAAAGVGLAVIGAIATWMATKPNPEKLEQAYNRGLLYQNGNGVPKDYAEALKAFRVAADGGLAKAQYALGGMYQQGWGVGKDPATAAKWYKLAADQNYPQAQNDLGVLYHNGLGVMPDLTIALQLYRKAADQGLPPAQRNLGMMYLMGEGAPRDYAQAMTWFQKAAEHGNQDAQFHLGLMYFYGEGVPKNQGEAFRVESTAAKSGYPLAENVVGYMYENGLGVDKDVNAALSWYQAAASRGLDAGKQNVARLSAALANAKRQADLLQQQQNAAAAAASQERRMRREQQANQQALARYQEVERQRQATEQAAIARQQEMARQRQAADAARQQQNNFFNNLLRGIVQPRP